MATLTINYTPQYAGSHRICYRIQASPANSYCCLVDSTPSSIGVPKSYVINIGASPCSGVPGVDTESCDPVIYEGYVQPTCDPDSSLDQRVAWNFDFNVTPTCTSYEVTCSSSGVLGMNITNPGSGYNPLSPPAVTIAAPTGSGPVQATGTAVIGNGAITGTTVLNSGAGYTDGTYPFCPLTGGTGTGADASVVISGGAVVGFILGNEGSGYSDSDNLSLDTGVVGVPGTPADVEVTSDLGELTSVLITTGGAGYIVVPSATVAAPGGMGVTATITAEMSPCSEMQSFDCVEDDADPGITIPFLETVVMCSKTTPVADDGYTITEGDPCCDCAQHTISVLGSDITVPLIYWTSCDGSSTRDLVSVVNQESGFTTSVCAIQGSVGIYPEYESLVDVIVTGPCS